MTRSGMISIGLLVMITTMWICTANTLLWLTWSIWWAIPVVLVFLVGLCLFQWGVHSE